MELRLTEEQVAIQRMVRDFVKRKIRPIALDLDRLEDHEKRMPLDVLKSASQLGLRTLALSKENGGSGADYLTCCIVTEELAVGDIGIAATLDQTSTFSHLWFDRAMTVKQRERFLPNFLADDMYHLAFAGHEPDTDLGWNYYNEVTPNTGYKTTAVQQSDGSWVINGIKNFITNGTIARLIAVQARTHAGTARFLVPSDTPGLTRQEHDKVGRRLGSNGELFFNNVRVPAENMLSQRGVALGRGTPRFQAMNLGIGRAAFEAALEFTRQRVQGGKPIIQHQAVGQVLAEMSIELEAARSIIWKAAWAADHPEAYSNGSLPNLPLQTIAKVFTSQAVHRVCVLAMQLFGGMGVMRELPVQKYVRDALIFLHSEASNDVARLRIAEAVAGYQRAESALVAG